MAYIFKTVTTKPVEASWVSDAMTETHVRYWQWVRKYPGCIGVTNHQVDDNTYERLVIFKNKSDFESWMIDRTQNEDFIARMNHQDDNNYTMVVESYEA